MSIQVGQVVRALPTANSLYTITNHTKCFYGLVINLSNKRRRGEMIPIIDVIPFCHTSESLSRMLHNSNINLKYAQQGAIWDYNKRKLEYHQDTLAIQKLLLNKDLKEEDIRNSKILSRIRSYDVEAQHFEAIQNTSFLSLKQEMIGSFQQRYGPYDKILSEESYPHSLKKDMDSLFKLLEPFAISVFSDTMRPNLSL